MASQCCNICQNSEGNAVFTSREMYLGTRDSFDYLECGHCGCLQLLQPPEDLSPYYPENYYAHQKSPLQKNWGIRYLGALKRKRLEYTLGHSSLTGALSAALSPPLNLPHWATRAGLTPASRILDVGCGNGHMILSLRNAGFIHLSGIDPFIRQDLTYDGNVTVKKGNLEDLNETYDFITMQHSFEHMPRPREVLEHVHHLLDGEGHLLISLPVAGCRAWHEYGADWVQLDPPRHLYLHTTKSLKMLATDTGFEVIDTHYNSNAFQFWGSEQIKNDIPLLDERSYLNNPEASPFSAADIRSFEQRADKLNHEGQGDQAEFLLRKNG